MDTYIAQYVLACIVFCMIVMSLILSVNNHRMIQQIKKNTDELRLKNTIKEEKEK